MKKSNHLIMSKCAMKMNVKYRMVLQMKNSHLSHGYMIKIYLKVRICCKLYALIILRRHVSFCEWIVWFFIWHHVIWEYWIWVCFGLFFWRYRLKWERFFRSLMGIWGFFEIFGFLMTFKILTPVIVLKTTETLSNLKASLG